jgi:transposase-like protein DUF772
MQSWPALTQEELAPTKAGARPDVNKEPAERDGRYLAAYDPRMMVRLLVYGYCRGVASSQRIERATYEDVAFRYLAAEHLDSHFNSAYRTLF